MFLFKFGHRQIDNMIAANVIEKFIYPFYPLESPSIDIFWLLFVSFCVVFFVERKRERHTHTERERERERERESNSNDRIYNLRQTNND